MGFFSWLTSDSKESIRNIHTGENRTVYLLQPDGAKPIREDGYEGYGAFGGIDAYAWLARANLPQDRVADFDDEELRDAGIALDCGSLLRLQDGRLLSVFHDSRKLCNALGLTVEHFPGRYDEPIPSCGGKSANQMAEAGTTQPVRLRDLGVIRHPLKFSFDPAARYEDLPAAEKDPDQGYF